MILLSTDHFLYFRNLKPDGQPAIFREWWMNKFNCDLPESTARKNPCASNLSLAYEDINPTAGFIVDAVYAIADGVRAASAYKCYGKVAICDDFLNSNDHLPMVRDEIVKAMAGSQFNITTGDPRKAQYAIYNLRRMFDSPLQVSFRKVSDLTAYAPC